MRPIWRTFSRCESFHAFSLLPTHLADAKGQISPRSFLVALKQAHTMTERHHGDSQLLLHFEGIKHGVQEASRVRLRELKEDYPWVEQLLKPLRGMTVPRGQDALAGARRRRRDPPGGA